MSDEFGVQSFLDTWRTESLRYMIHTATIRGRAFNGVDDHDRFSRATGVAARFDPGFGIFRIYADRFAGKMMWTVTLPYGTEVNTGDGIINEATSDTFEVRIVNDGNKTLQSNVRVLAERIT